MFISIVLALMGLFLIYLDFFLPGSIFAIGGALLLFSSIFLLIAQKVHLLYFISFALLVLILTILVIKTALRRIKSNKDIFLHTDQEGYKAASLKKELIGKTGVAFTDLRPFGKVLINDKYYFASTPENYIVKGKKIKIVATHSSNLIVKEIKK